MLLSDIYNTAAALISETEDGSDNDDLKARAPYLLSAIIAELKPIDDSASGEVKTYGPSFTSLDQTFPLCDGLAPVCAYKLAYLLIADENTLLYQMLRSEYETARNNFIAGVPAVCEKMKNRYR